MGKGSFAGDVIRDMDKLFNVFGVSYFDREMGRWWGSVHLYVASKTDLA